MRRESGQVRYLCQHQETRFKMAFSDSIAKPGTQAAGSLSSAGPGIGVAQACHSANSIPNRGQAGKRRVDRSVTWSRKSREGRSDRRRLRQVRAGKVIDAATPPRAAQRRNRNCRAQPRDRFFVHRPAPASPGPWSRSSYRWYKLPAEPICRPVQIIKCAVQPVFFALAVFFWDSVGAPRRSRRG